jgi:hypothetical protein
MEFPQIAAECGYASGAVARAAVGRALLQTLQAPADELRAVELNLINQAITECWRIISDTQCLTDKSGKPVVMLGEDGLEYAVADQGIQVQALQAMQKFSESRRKLMGLDAPQRSVRANLTLQELQQMAIDNGVPADEVYANVMAG